MQRVKQLEEDQKRLLDDKREIYEALCTGSVVSKAVTLSGSIDGHEVDVRGVILRKGVGSDHPPSACKICARMISLGSTEKMIENGIRCQWAGIEMRGHITNWPAELKKTMEDPEFLQKFKHTGWNYRRRAAKRNQNNGDLVFNNDPPKKEVGKN